MVSDLLPNLAAMTDDFCFFHALHTETAAILQGENFFNTGFTMEGFPSFGAWVTYALGTENTDLPGLWPSMIRAGWRCRARTTLAAAFCRRPFRERISPAKIRRTICAAEAIRCG